MATYQLAQVNVGILAAPLDSPQLYGFTSRLEEINALADGAPGFVWRLQTADGDATALRPFADDRLLINMSVWASVEALADFVYRSDHVAVMRQRRQYFVHLEEAIAATWWIPAGTLPTAAEADVRLRLLRDQGPTPASFTLQRPYGPPGDAEPLPVVDDRLCPA